MAPISLFIPTLNAGGAQKVFVNLANALVDQTDRPIHLVLLRAEGEFLHQVRAEVKIVSLEAKRVLHAVFKLRRYVMLTKPLVMMSTLHYVNLVAIVAHLLTFGASRLVVREAAIVPDPKTILFMNFRLKVRVFLMRLLYRYASVVVANSSDTLISLVRAGVSGIENTVVIGNPIELSALADTDTIEVLSGLPAKYICAIGRLSEEKDFSTLIKAIAKVEDKDLALVIIGEGAERRNLTKKAEDLGISHKVYFTGYVDNPGMILKKASLFVLSSRTEGFGNVLVEALLAGTPIVATDCPGGPRDILSKGEFGMLVPVGDENAMSKAISESLKNPISTPEKRRSRGLEFSPEKIAKAYLQLMLCERSQDFKL